jgi:Tfp pilus assembly protein PilF
VPFSYEEQLRLLGSDIFEELAAQLVKREDPSARHVRGAGGDGGIDVHTGALHAASPSTEPLRVWQVKFFRDGIGDTQKRQVLKSLKKVLPQRPVAWTLVVPVNLTTAALAWFEEVKAAHPEMEVRLWQADEVLRRMHKASLIDLYLMRPNESACTEEVERILARLDDFVPVATLLDGARAALAHDAKSAEAFYRGTVPDWRDIVSGFDGARDATGALWRWMAAQSAQQPRTSVAVLLGQSGEGKSTILMRAAAELVQQGQPLVLYHKEDRDTLSAEQFAELPAGTTCFLVIDRLTRFAADVLHGFLERLHRLPLRVIIIGASVRSMWDGSDVHLEDVADVTPISVGRLSDDDIDAILDKLRMDPSYLGTLAELPPAEQRRRFRRKAGRQLLVAMLEIHGDESLDARIVRELQEVERKNRDARRAVVYICAMHRFDTPMPAATLRKLVPELDLAELTRAASGIVRSSGQMLVSRHALVADLVMGSERDAARRYCEIVAAGEERDSYRIARALHMLSLRDAAAAALPLQDAAARFSTNPALFVTQAVAARGRGDIEGARAMYRRAATIDLNLDVTCSVWGNFEREQRNLGTRSAPEPETARWLFARAAEINPRDVYVWCNWATLEAEAVGIGSFHEPYSARWLFMKLFELDSANLPGLTSWAVAEARAGNLGAVDAPERFSARWLFVRGFEIDPHRVPLVSAWGTVEGRAGNYGSFDAPEPFTARWLFRLATTTAPRNFIPWISWAHCERSARNIGSDEQPEERTARWLFAKALTIQERLESLIAFAEMERHDCRNIARAEDLYLRAAKVAVEPNDRGRIYFSLGMTFSEMRNNSKAVEYLTRAVDIAPNDHIAHAKLGRSHSFLQNNALAEHHFRRALEIAPGDARTQQWYQTFLRYRRPQATRDRV